MQRICTAVLLALVLASSMAPTGRAAQEQQSESLTGLVGVVWGDSPDGSGTPPKVDLYDDTGKAHELKMQPDTLAAAGGLTTLNGARVNVRGSSEVSSLGAGGEAAFKVEGIEPTGEASALDSVTGSKPWIILMCKFAGNASQPRGPSYFRDLFGRTYPGINHFWERNSYGALNLDGTTVYPSWVSMPQTRQYYLDLKAHGLDWLGALLYDCARAVNASINFASYAGIGLMFNSEIDGAAWGGTKYFTLDGLAIIRVIWAPPWAYNNQHALAHEVGHGLGLPHSSGSYNTAYDSPWDVMSGWPTCTPSHPRYGCLAVETISHHRRIMGWVPTAKRYFASVGSDRQISLVRLGNPASPQGTYRMATIPIPGSSTRFYTVEARKPANDGITLNDYEEGLMAPGVIIHEVDTSRGDREAQVVDVPRNGTPRDNGSRFIVGETFADNSAGIWVRVMRATATGYVVRIRNGLLANDSPSGATVIDAYHDNKSQETGVATSDLGDPVMTCGSSAGTATVWYKFTAPDSGTLHLSTVGSDFDTLLSVWKGSEGSLSQVACDDDSGGNGASYLSTPVTAGTVYYLEVAGKQGPGLLNFSLDFTP
jgi:M6 family metalloprotease-like protein